MTQHRKDIGYSCKTNQNAMLTWYMAFRSKLESLEFYEMRWGIVPILLWIRSHRINHISNESTNQPTYQPIYLSYSSFSKRGSVSFSSLYRKSFICCFFCSTALYSVPFLHLFLSLSLFLFLSLSLFLQLCLYLYLYLSNPFHLLPTYTTSTSISISI